MCVCMRVCVRALVHECVCACVCVCGGGGGCVGGGGGGVSVRALASGWVGGCGRAWNHVKLE